MQRQFTQNVGSRFRKGDIRSYPEPVWKQIAASASVSLDKCTRLVEQQRPRRQGAGGVQ